jgi:DNA-binding LacI/PurR family transcriptional regulator
VPEDLAIVGAGDIMHGDLLRVPLTTIAWSREELGREAARLVIEQIEARPEGLVHRVVVPPSLLVRESCGAALPLSARAPAASRATSALP